MIVELWVLIACAGLNFILIMIQQLHTDIHMGIKYALSNRTEPKLATDFSGRVDRALNNFQENMLLFLPVALVVVFIGSTSDTQLGAVLFVFGRVAHAVTYIAGILYLRSVVWMIGLIGIGLMIYDLVVRFL